MNNMKNSRSNSGSGSGGSSENMNECIQSVDISEKERKYSKERQESMKLSKLISNHIGDHTLSES